jgi:hypothetical protein
MKRGRSTLKKKCRKCSVAEKVGGCLFGCNRKERLTRELELLIRGADSRIDPLVELLRQCPEAFTAGKALERIFQQLRARSPETNGRVLPPHMGKSCTSILSKPSVRCW